LASAREPRLAALWPCRTGVLEKLTRHKRDWQAHYDAFKEFIVGGADGQVKRAASKFGLVAMAGKLAIE
jgi:hypothetical protein